MTLYEAIDKLKSIKKLMEFNLELIAGVSYLKISLLEEAKREYLAAIYELSSLTPLGSENPELNQLKSDVGILYAKVSTLLEEATKATAVANLSPSTELSSSSPLSELSLRKPTSSDIILAYAKKLIAHSFFEDRSIFHISSPEKWDINDFSQEYNLRKNIIPRLFDINRHHASPIGKDGGVWFDPYGREGITPKEGEAASLAYSTCVSGVHGDDSVLQYIYSYDAQSILEEYKRKYGFFSEFHFQGTFDIEGVTLGEVRVPINSEIKDFLHFLGGIGALPSHDIMLHLYTRQYPFLSTSLPEFSERMSFRLKQKVVFEDTSSHFTPDDSLMIVFNSLKGLDSIATELAQCLENSSLEMNRFYYMVTLNLVQGIQKIYSEQSAPVNFAVDRISDLISQSKSSDYSEFLKCMSLIWDELRWLSKPSININLAPHPIKQKLYEETITALKVYSEFISDYPPAHASLGTSGMNVLVHSIHNAIKELTDGGKIAALRYGENNYFEIGSFLRQYLRGCDNHLENGATIYTDGNNAITKPSDWPEDLVTLYIDIPFANIGVKTAGSKYTHVNDFIEEQLKLREKIVKPPPLICVLDTTVGYSNDVFIKWTLTQFKDAIEKGLLYVFFAHSLNKSWTMGLDKGCAGFCHQYGNLDYFPLLKNKIDQDVIRHNLGGQSLTGSTVSFIKLIMSSCPDLIDRYSEHIHSHNRFVHQSILKSLIGAKENYIVLDDPQYYPYIKDSHEPLMELADMSTFVTIRLNEKYHLDENIHQFFNFLATNLFNDIGIISRDGYGFAETACTCIHPLGKAAILRISVGSESPEVHAARFSRIKDFIVAFNQVIGTYFPLIHGQEECKDPDIKLIALRELVKNYLSQYPKDNNFPLVCEKVTAIFQKFAAGYIEESRAKKAAQQPCSTDYYRAEVRNIKDSLPLEEPSKPGPTN